MKPSRLLYIILRGTKMFPVGVKQCIISCARTFEPWDVTPPIASDRRLGRPKPHYTLYRSVESIR